LSRKPIDLKQSRAAVWELRRELIMRGNRITSQSLLISLIFHGVILLVLGAYITYTQSPVIQEFVASTFLKPQKAEKPPDRPPEIKPVVKPTIPTEQIVIIQDIPVVPRVSTAAVVRIPAMYAAIATLEYSDMPIQHDILANPNVPRVEVMPDVVTYANIPTTTSPDGITVAPPVSAKTAPDVGRGIVGDQVRVARPALKPNALAMIKNISAADTGLTDVVQAVHMGSVDVPPLPRGDPGGHVVGNGKDIRGVFRLVRVQHDLADWWADQSSLVALTEWLNSQTNIKTDMNVEGGAVRLTDPKLSKAPLAFFTGHDPAHVRSQNLTRGAPLRNRLTQQERDGMRRYLVEDGGFIYFDDCGVNAPAEAFVRMVMA
jgi:uncharacterized protein DUF4159